MSKCILNFLDTLRQFIKTSCVRWGVREIPRAAWPWESPFPDTGCPANAPGPRSMELPGGQAMPALKSKRESFPSGRNGAGMLSVIPPAKYGRKILDVLYKRNMEDSERWKNKAVARDLGTPVMTRR